MYVTINGNLLLVKILRQGCKPLTNRQQPAASQQLAPSNQQPTTCNQSTTDSLVMNEKEPDSRTRRIKQDKLEMDMEMDMEMDQPAVKYSPATDTLTTARPRARASASALTPPASPKTSSLGMMQEQMRQLHHEEEYIHKKVLNTGKGQLQLQQEHHHHPVETVVENSKKSDHCHHCHTPGTKNGDLMESGKGIQEVSQYSGVPFVGQVTELLILSLLGVALRLIYKSWLYNPNLEVASSILCGIYFAVCFAIFSCCWGLENT